MTISLSAENEQLITEAIRAGIIRSADEALDDALENIRQRLQARQHKLSSSQAAERLATFGQRHHLSLGDLTVKDLINEGRA